MTKPIVVFDTSQIVIIVTSIIIASLYISFAVWYNFLNAVELAAFSFKDKYSTAGGWWNLEFVGVRFSPFLTNTASNNT